MSCITTALSRFERKVSNKAMVSILGDVKDENNIDEYIEAAQHGLNKLAKEREDLINEYIKPKEPPRGTEAPQAVKAKKERPQPAKGAVPTDLTPEAQDWYSKHREDNPALVGKYPADADVTQRDRWLENAIQLAEGKVNIVDERGIERTIPVPDGVHQLLDIYDVDTKRPREEVLAGLKAKMESTNPAVSPKEQLARVEKLNKKMRNNAALYERLRRNKDVDSLLRALEKAQKAGNEAEFNDVHRQLMDVSDDQDLGGKQTKRTADVIDEMEAAEDEAADADFSKPGVTGPVGMNHARVMTELYKIGRRAIDKLMSTGVLVVQRSDDLEFEGLRKKVREVRAPGMYYDGVAYLFTDHMRPEILFKTFWHEVGEHFGLQKMLGTEDYNDIASQVMQAATEKGSPFKEAFDHVKANYPELKEGDDQFISEVLARAGEQNSPKLKPLLARVYNTIRQWLREMGFVRTISKQEMEWLLQRGAMRAVKVAEDGSGSVQLSKANDFGDFSQSAFAHALAEVTGEPETVKQVMDTPNLTPDLKRKMMNEAVRVRGAEGKRIAQEQKVLFSKSPVVASLQPAYREFIGDTGQKALSDFQQTIRTAGNKLTTLSNLVRSFEGKLPSIKTWHDVLQKLSDDRTTREQVATEILNRAGKLKKAVSDKMEMFLYDSTFEQKWAYDPGFTRTYQSKDDDGNTTLKSKPVKVTVDPEFAKRFAALEKESPEAAQTIKDIFAYGEKTRQDTRGIMRELGISDAFLRVGQLEGPYAPLRRFGTYVVEVKSQKVLDMESRLAAKKSDVSVMDKGIDELEKKDEDTTVQRGLRKEVKKGIEKLSTELDDLKRLEEHYSLTFHDTRGDADVHKRKLVQTGRYAESYSGPRKQALYDAQQMPQQALQKVLTAVNGQELPANVAKQLEDTIMGVYQTTVEDHMARQSMRQRKFRFGADTNMLRSFEAQSVSDAVFLAHMKHGKELSQATADLRKDADTSKDPDLIDAANTALAHQEAMASYRPNKFVEAVRSGLSAWQLALSPAYYVANATQPFMKSVPMIAAEFAGDVNNPGFAKDWKRAIKLLMDGYKLWSKLRATDFDLKTVADEGVRKMLETAKARNLLDVGLIDDYSQFERITTGYKLFDDTTLELGKVFHKIRQMTRFVERMNRVSTASAAYKMALEKKRTEDEAIHFAIRVLEATQGDNSSLDAPLAIKQLPRLLTIYRRYQLMVATLYVKAFKHAFWGATPEERVVGKRLLALQLGHAALAGGALGLPLMNVVALVLSALGDDDEPQDFERWMKDAGVPDWMLKGPLNMLGLDMGAKLGDDKAFSILPFTDIDFTSRKGVTDMAMGLLGPAGTQATRMADGIDMLSQGDIGKGIERLSPTGVGNAMKGWREANEGITIRNGDVIVRPEDISTFQSFMSMLGMPASDIQRYRWAQSQQVEIVQFYRENETKLRNQYVKAVKDSDSTTEITAKWERLQNAKMNLHPFFGTIPTELKPKPVAQLAKAPEDRAKTERERQQMMSN